MWRQQLRRATVSLSLAVALALAVGCSGATGERTDDPVTALSPSQMNALLAAVASDAIYPQVQGIGVNVTGSGEVVVVPDIAVLSMGVEGRGSTVAAARAVAANAMDGVIEALRANSVADRDIVTQYFSIQPEYVYVQITEDPDAVGGVVQRTEQRLIGYRVANTILSKVRNLAALGAIIDGSVEAGGDAVRVNGITFTLDDPAAAARQARGLAVADAVAKATLMVTDGGAQLGKLAFISETSSIYPKKEITPPSRDEGLAGGPSVISPGEMSVMVTVHAIWAIE
jgi:uncharacterized protein YggE